MIYLTIINTLPVKKKMKNAFYENHIFTRFNLSISLEGSSWPNPAVHLTFILYTVAVTY